jgi:hypothetical protein
VNDFKADKFEQSMTVTDEESFDEAVKELSSMTTAPLLESACKENGLTGGGSKFDKTVRLVHFTAGL